MPLAPAIEHYGASGRVRGDGDGLSVDIRLSRGLRSWPIVDARGAHVATVHGLLLDGWLGPSLSSDGQSVRVDAPIDSPAALEKIVVRGLAGSLLLETLGNGLGRRLYHDCGASMPLVYSPEDQAFGGSADMFLDDTAYGARLLPDRVQRLVLGEGRGGWISGTLTAHAGVSRLLANHYLDLETFTAHRFWPSAELLAAEPPPLEDAAREAARQMAGFTRAASERFRIGLGLTAGLDSRIVLASFQGHTERLLCLTVDESGSVDAEISARLCDTFGIRHLPLKAVYAEDARLERWDRMVGHALRSNNREIHPTFEAVDADLLMNGLYGEPARCFLYAHDWRDVNSIAADAQNLLGRLKQPRDADMLADTQAWLAPLMGLPRSTIFDLAYLELRMGSWAMGQGPATRARKWSLMPFAQWRVQELFLTQRLEDKGQERILPMIGEILWPEVMRLPINRFGDWRDRLGKLSKLAPRAGFVQTVRRYSRKRLAR